MKATIMVGDVLERLRNLPDESMQCVVTSPPYWGLRDYGTAQWESGDAGCDHRAKGERRQIPHGDGRPVETDSYAQNRTLIPGAGANLKWVCGKCGATRIDQQLGLEKTPSEYVEKMVAVFAEVRRVLRDDGTLWLNIGDSYCSGGRATWRSGASENKGQDIQNDMATPAQPENMKPKDLIGIPWMLAFALRADGWYLRQDIIWSKPNPMPESVTDRCTKAHEYLFLLTKSARYYYDQEAILEPCSPATHDRLSQNVQEQVGSERAHAGGKTNGNMKAVGRMPDEYHGSIPGRKNGPGQDRRGDGARGRTLGKKGQQANADENRSAKGAAFGRGAGWRKLAAEQSGIKNNESFDAAMAIMSVKRNKRSVWTITTQPYSEAHFATFPEALVESCILAGSKPGDVVLDPFCGSGTTGVVALRYHRDFMGIELNPEYVKLAKNRIGKEAPMFNNVVST